MCIYTITIAVDTPEAFSFADWLEARGHSATVGDTSGDYVDGIWTSTDAAAAAVLNRLWGEYCSR